MRPLPLLEFILYLIVAKVCGSLGPLCKRRETLCSDSIGRDWKKWIAEVLGTFCLVFSGTGAIVVNDLSGGTVTHVGVALTFGLVVMSMIYAIGDVSGAHLNPAVTLGFWLAIFRSSRDPLCGKPTRRGIPCKRADACDLSHARQLGCNETCRISVPVVRAGDCSDGDADVRNPGRLQWSEREGADGRNRGRRGDCTGGAVRGTDLRPSMNPARSLAPAVVSGSLTHLWIYLAASPLGATIGVVCCRAVHPPGVARTSTEETAFAGAVMNSRRAKQHH